jgi:hypothetical protein
VEFFSPHAADKSAIFVVFEQSAEAFSAMHGRFRHPRQLRTTPEQVQLGRRAGCPRATTRLKRLVESRGGEVVGLAVVIYQPEPGALSFDPLPFYYLARLDPRYYKDAATCDLCKRGVPVDKVWV